jgi:3-dehydroquinate synthase
MVTITINTSREYCVKVGHGLLHQLGPEAAKVISGRTAMIVSDDNVWPIYGNTAVNSLKRAGFIVHSHIIPAGESSKNGESYLNLLQTLALRQITRSDCIIALGGGVVGDLAGFAAATYLRGIDYIQLPTTLLAMVDSSVGGKTAINLPAGKNLAGVFYQPRLVLCDIHTLDTLSQAVFADGCAEVIKYGVLFDQNLFDHLEEMGPDFDREAVVAQCIRWKKEVVSADEFDTGDRRLLNLGHTIGHGIEKASDYHIPHGSAVAIGMSMISRYAASHALCYEEDRDRMISVIERFGLPTHTTLPTEALIKHAFSDKKRTGDTITLVIPATIGCCRLCQMPVSALQNIVKEGM